jgi:hypothetical protein
LYENRVPGWIILGNIALCENQQKIVGQKEISGRTKYGRV